MADRLISLFYSLASEKKSGHKQLTLLREYMTIKNDADAVEEFVKRLEVARLTAPEIPRALAKPSAPSPSIQVTAVTDTTVPKKVAILETLAKKRVEREAAEAAAKAATDAEEARRAKEVANAEAAAKAAVDAEEARRAKEVANAEAEEALINENEAEQQVNEQNQQEEKQELLDPDRLYVREEPELGEDNLGDVEDRETLAQGDCFFSAIFRAAWEEGFVTDMLDCLEIPYDEDDLEPLPTEQEFVIGFRMKIADELRANRIPNAEGQVNAAGNKIDLYTHYTQLFETTAIIGEILETTDYYQVLIHKKPTWMKKPFVTDLLILEKVGFRNRIIGRKRPTFYTREEFLNILIQNIEAPRNYVAEIEYRIARRLLRACGYKLVVYNVTGEEKVPKEGILDGKQVPRINIINLGEGHFVYYSFQIGEPSHFSPNANGGGRRQKEKRFGITRKSSTSQKHSTRKRTRKL